MSWGNGETYLGYWKNGLQHGEGEIHVQLKFANMMQKIVFNKGNPSIRK
jgi:hypothetical protein